MKAFCKVLCKSEGFKVISPQQSEDRINDLRGKDVTKRRETSVMPGHFLVIEIVILWWHVAMGTR